MIRFYGVTLALLLSLVQGKSEVSAVPVPANDAVKNVEYFGSAPTTSLHHLDDLKNHASKWKDQAPIVFNPIDKNDTATYKRKDNAANRYGIYRITFGDVKFWVAYHFNAVYNNISIGLPENKLIINIDREQGDSDAFYIFNHDGVYLTKREGSSFAPGNANQSFRIESETDANNVETFYLNLYGHDDTTRKSQLDRITGEYLIKTPDVQIESIEIEKF
jgi:hypothetical protein